MHSSPIVAALLFALLCGLAACSPEPEPLPVPDPLDSEAVAALFPWPEEEIECIAKAAYFEARGEGAEGMTAVAHVVYNRTLAPSFPDTPCAVVAQSSGRACQFSFMCDGKPEFAANRKAYAEARAIAERVVAGASEDPTQGAVMFHAERIPPYWAESFTRTASLGGHIFYRLD
jgi:N-acetylmuramoyl-L-alanine amidase